jgi:hypothetical protein
LVPRRGRSGCQPRRRAPRAGRALSDFGDASTATLLRDVVKDGQVARDLRTHLDAGAAALASLDTYLGTFYRWATGGGNLRQQLLPVLDTVLTELLPTR